MKKITLKPETVIRRQAARADEVARESIRRRKLWLERIAAYSARGWDDLARTEQELFDEHYPR